MQANILHFASSGKTAAISGQWLCGFFPKVIQLNTIAMTDPAYWTPPLLVSATASASTTLFSIAYRAAK